VAKTKYLCLRNDYAHVMFTVQLNDKLSLFEYTIYLISLDASVKKSIVYSSHKVL